MMLGVPGLIMADGAAAAALAESGGASGGSSDLGGGMEESGGGGGGGGGGGNRWPRQETLALLRIRSDMDATFRDASLKGPLWEEVSRKLGELGFQRSAKKCKEKFENVYKYHKRTKDGRASKSDGKTYRFFDQLEALENTPPNNHHFTPPPPPPPRPPAATTTAPPPPPLNTTSIPMPPHVTVSSATSPTPLSVANPISYSPFQPPLNPPPQSHHFQLSHRPISTSPASNATSSSTSSDEDIQRRRGRKRKWKDYLERLMKDVVKRQEELQKRFLETLEKREKDRIAREEAWRVQEMARMNREHDRLAHERSVAATKDAAVIAFLQKVTGEQSPQIPVKNNNNNAIVQQVAQPPENQKPPQPPPSQQPLLPPPPIAAAPTDNGGGDELLSASSSRWPKAEVEALIKLRTDLENRYQENGPKGPLWEEISKSMAKIGYSRSSKRCKEKWENINKYFKKVKESNKKRPEDSKTCPYFQQLDAIYKERTKNHLPGLKPEVAIMARPEQQWPQQQNRALHALDNDNDSEKNENENEEFEDEDEEEEEEVGEYEMVANKQPSSVE